MQAVLRRRRAAASALVAFAIATPLFAGAQQPVTPFAVRKAESLLRDHLPCLGCHALGEEGGRLAPDLRTVGQRRSAAWIAAMVDDPQRTVPGSIMPRTIMPAATRDAIVRYLQSGASTQPAAPARTTPLPEAADGAALYARWCASCHGSCGSSGRASCAATS